MEPGLDLVALLMIAAFLAGAIDAVAGGGGMITLPALLAAGVPPVQAIATNKLQSTFGTGGAVLAFARKGHIDFRRFAVPTAAAFVGSGLGAYLLTQLDPAFLEGFLPLLLIAMAIYFAVAPRMGEAREGRHPDRRGSLPARLARGPAALGRLLRHHHRGPDRHPLGR